MNQEIRNRVRLTVAAYAYEFFNTQLMTDHEFDALALSINPRISTGNDKLDEFFRTEFVTFSGVWIHNHPDLDSTRKAYMNLVKSTVKSYDQINNEDLFGPLLSEPEKIIEWCRRCRRDTSLNPVKGGCHC